MGLATLELNDFVQRRDQFIRRMGQNVRTAVRGAAEDGAEFARTHHRHVSRTGKLTSSEMLYASVRKVSDRGADAEIRNDAPYAKAIEYGARPHIIRAKHAQALRFEIGGRTIFRAFVNHPGNAPLPFMEPAGEHAGDQLIARLMRGFDEVAAVWD